MIGPPRLLLRGGQPARGSGAHPAQRRRPVGALAHDALLGLDARQVGYQLALERLERAGNDGSPSGPVATTALPRRTASLRGTRVRASCRGACTRSRRRGRGRRSAACSGARGGGTWACRRSAVQPALPSTSTGSLVAVADPSAFVPVTTHLSFLPFALAGMLERLRRCARHGRAVDRPGVGELSDLPSRSRSGSRPSCRCGRRRSPGAARSSSAGTRTGPGPDRRRWGRWWRRRRVGEHQRHVVGIAVVVRPVGARHRRSPRAPRGRSLGTLAEAVRCWSSVALPRSPRVTGPIRIDVPRSLPVRVEPLGADGRGVVVGREAAEEGGQRRLAPGRRRWPAASAATGR